MEVTDPEPKPKETETKPTYIHTGIHIYTYI
jgi:hypothetical protein